MYVLMEIFGPHLKLKFKTNSQLKYKMAHWYRNQVTRWQILV